MKCEHCGKNEATFFYKSSVNGHVTQVHLCQDCARAMGYTSSLRRSMRPMSLFGDDDFFSRPFSMLEPLLEGFGTRSSRRRVGRRLWRRRSLRKAQVL